MVQPTDEHPGATGSRVERPSPSLRAQLFDRFADGVVVSDQQGRCVEANLTAADLLGYTRDELIGLPLSLVVASEPPDAEWARSSPEGAWRGEVQLRRADGTTFSAEARETTIESQDGRWGVLILRESGDAVVRALRATEAQLAAIVESSNDAIFSGSIDGTILTWNEGAERLFGYRPEEIVGRHLSVLAPSERRGEPEGKLRALQRGRRLREFETIRLRKDGVPAEVSLSVSPIRDTSGTVTGFAEIARDVSERRVAERRAQVLYRLIEALGRARSDERIFEAALDALQRALHTDRASILLFDEDGVMRFRAWRGLGEAYRQAVEGHNPWAGVEDGFPPVHVPDAEADPSIDAFRDSVLAEGIRALSFVALQHQGRLLGKVMLYFDAPRSLSSSESQLAVAIADHVAFALTRARAEEALERAQAQLDLITIGSADGLTIQAADGRVVYANLAAARLSGFDSVPEFLQGVEAMGDRWELFDEHGMPFEPSQLPGRRALLGEPGPEAIIKIRDRKTGVERWRRVRATAAAGEHGTVPFAINLFHDITEERRAREQLRFQAALLHAQAEASVEGILVVATDGRMVSWNQRFAEMWAIPDDVLASRSDRLAIDSVLSKVADPEGFRRRIDDLYADPVIEASDEIELLDGRSFERHTKPLIDEAGAGWGRIWFFRDATEERRREGFQRLLADAGRALALSLEGETRFGALLDAVIRWNADVAALYVDEGDAVRLVDLRANDPSAIEGPVREAFRLQDRPSRSAREAVLIHRSVLVNDVDDVVEPPAGGRALFELARLARLGSAAIVPIRAGEEVLGVLAAALERGGQRYDQSDLAALEALAERVALAFQSSKLYGERDFIARTLQRGLLPAEIPEVPGLEIAARYRAAGGGADVGGDFYDVFELNEASVAIAVGDVCGKGPTAAVLTGVARHTIRTAASLMDRPARILELVHEAIQREGREEEFCTVALGRLDRTGAGLRVHLSLGGHPRPLLVHGDGSVEQLGEPGSLLGLLPDVRLSETVHDLQPGDTVVLFTDGVIEQRTGQEFGSPELANLLRSASALSPAEIADRIEQAVTRFNPDPRDDVAVLVVRVTA